MTLLFTLILTVLQWNTRLPLFFCCCSLHFSDTECGQLSISFSRIKRHPKAWWSAEVEKTVSERPRLSLPLTKVMKIVRLTSPLPDMPRLSSPRPRSKPRLRHGRRLALLFYLNLTLNLCTLSLVLLLTLFPHLPPILASPTAPLPGSWLRSSLAT